MDFLDFFPPKPAVSVGKFNNFTACLIFSTFMGCSCAVYLLLLICERFIINQIQLFSPFIKSNYFGKPVFHYENTFKIIFLSWGIYLPFQPSSWFSSSRLHLQWAFLNTTLLCMFGVLSSHPSPSKSYPSYYSYRKWWLGFFIIISFLLLWFWFPWTHPSLLVHAPLLWWFVQVVLLHVVASRDSEAMDS